MSSLITTPEYLSKDKLKTELKNYGIRFNQNENKQYYVNLYRKRIMDTEQSRQEFSSDEEFIRPAKQGKKQQVSFSCTKASLCTGALYLEEKLTLL